MNITEAYIISLPETYLILAISILIINGLVGVEKKRVIQNPLVEQNSISNIGSTEGSAVVESSSLSAEKETKESRLKLSRNKLDKSIVPLGILSLALAILLLSNIDPQSGISYVGRFILDNYAKTIKIIVLVGSVVIMLIGLDTIRNMSKGRQYLPKKLQSKETTATLINILEPNLELVVLMILAVVGLMIIISSYDLLSLYVGIELQSFSLYVLAAYKRSSEFSTEAGLKYFMLGAIASGFILFGSSIIYGVTGTIQFEEIAKILLLKDQTVIIGLLFVLSGLFFKSSIAPFHQWTPDVYEGSPTLITLVFASIPKLAIFSVIVRILSLIPSSAAIGSGSAFLSTEVGNLTSPLISFNIINNILMGCAILSMTIGAITGLYQQKLKRLLAYSTILNMGYVLIGLISMSIDGLQSLFFYLLIYLFTNVGVFTLLLAIKELRTVPGSNPSPAGIYSLVYITDLQKLRNQPLLAFCFIIIIASFAGFPPLAGFFAKLYIFFSAIAFQYYLLLLVAVILSVISCFYYLRLIKYIYFAPVKSSVFILPISLIHSIILSVVVLCLILFMFYPGPLLTLSLSLALDILA